MRLFLMALAGVFLFLAPGTASAQVPPAVQLMNREAECKSGDAAACWAAGRHYGSFLSMLPDDAKAATFFTRACQLGDDRGCSDLAELQLRAGPAHNPAAALRYFQAKCAGGEAETCLLLAQIYTEGKDGLAKNLPSARSFAQKACNLNNVDGCRLFAPMAFSGGGGPADKAAAYRAVEKACDLKSVDACMTIADMATGGQGNPPDGPRALTFAEKACSLNSADGCQLAAAIAAEGQILPPNGPRALRAAQRACDLKSPHGCLQAEFLFRDGKLVPADMTKAKAAALNACELKSLDGCRTYQAHVQQAPADPAEPAAALYALCQLKDADACVAFGRMAEEGDGIAKDNFKAFMAYKAALAIDPDHAEAKQRAEAAGKKPVT